MRFLVLLQVLLVAGCHPCNRDSKVWVAGQIVVTFKMGITTSEATAIVTGLGYSYTEAFPGFGVATVPHGDECWAEERLMEEPGVNSALQDTYVSDR